MSKEFFLAKYGSEEHAKKLIKDSKSTLGGGQLHSLAALTPHQKIIDELIDHPIHQIRWQLAQNPNLQEHHVKKLLKDPHADVSEEMKFQKMYNESSRGWEAA